MHLSSESNTTTTATSTTVTTITSSTIALICNDQFLPSSQSDNNNSNNFVAIVFPSLSLDCDQSLNSTAISSVVQLFPLELRTTATVVCAFVMAFGIAGNILVPFVVCRTKDLCNSTNLFLINLSVADLLVIIVCMPSVLIELHSQPEVWKLGEGMSHGSILTILAISLERYYAICKPLKAGYKCTLHRAIVIIIILWSVAFVATIPVLFGTELSEARYIDGSLVSVCLTKANTNWQKIYYLASMTAFFWAPLCVLLVIYSVITKRLILDDRITNNSDGRITCNSDHIQMRARRQVVFMLAAVVTCFFICLLPFRLLTLWLIIASEDQIKELSMETFYNLLYFCRIMLYVNSMLNPCLYAVVSSKFRNAFMIVLCYRKRNRLLIRNSTFNTTTSSVVMSSLKNSLHRTAQHTNATATIHNQQTSPMSCTSLQNPLFDAKYCDINQKNYNCFSGERNQNNILARQQFDPYVLKTMSSEESYV